MWYLSFQCFDQARAPLPSISLLACLTETAGPDGWVQDVLSWGSGESQVPSLRRRLQLPLTGDYLPLLPPGLEQLSTLKMHSYPPCAHACICQCLHAHTCILYGHMPGNTLDQMRPDSHESQKKRASFLLIYPSNYALGEILTTLENPRLATGRQPHLTLSPTCRASKTSQSLYQALMMMTISPCIILVMYQCL